MYHNKNLLCKTFTPEQKVLLYESHLHLFRGKMKSYWIGPYIIKTVFSYGTVEIENPKDGNIFKVNGHRLKPFLEGFEPELESTPLEDLNYGSL